MKKILAFTSIRSDYDLMSPLYKLLHESSDIDFKLIVSGAHLSHDFGYSIEQIKKDNFDLLLEIETLLSSDTGLSRVKSASLLLQNSLETIAKYNPNLIIYAGDREDVLIYAMIGGYLNIPTIHFYGGDHVEDGYIDNPVRHATSKLSTAHFVTIKEHKKRLIRMGENPSRIHITGNISLDKFVSFQLKSKVDIASFFKLSKTLDDFALMIFHPITGEKEHVEKYYKNILDNLSSKCIKTFVGYPNVDPGNKKLLDVIEEYSKNDNFIFYKNLDRDIFMSIYKQAKFIIGNSSSGICESASFRIPAINVGLRQTNRLANDNVIFCGTSYEKIDEAIKLALSNDFQKKVKSIVNLYGDGNSAKKAFKLIKTIDFKTMIAKFEDPLKVKIDE